MLVLLLMAHNTFLPKYVRLVPGCFWDLFLHMSAASYISFVRTIGNLNAKHPQNCRMSSLGSHKAKKMRNAIISYILLLNTCSMCECGDTGVMFLKTHSTQSGATYGLPLLDLIFSYS